MIRTVPFKTVLLIAVLAAAALPVFGKFGDKVPVTGRRSLAVVPDKKVDAQSAEAYRELIAGAKLSGDPAAVDMVRRVGARIAAVSNRPDFQWEYNLIDDPATVNAFCMPGGKVAVYTGILPVTRDETGLAVVMGHEVAHAIAKHGAERISQAMALSAGQKLVGQLTKDAQAQTKAAVNAAYGIGANVGLALPYGRMQESEADRIGLVYMAKAGYDPREAAAFWGRMGALGGGKQPPQFLSTHPSHETRIKDIQKWLPEALAEYEKSPYR